jgi:hypothetical protein
MTDNSLIARRQGWVPAWVDDNFIMMHAESDFYLNLTGSGGRIWATGVAAQRFGFVRDSWPRV